MKKFILHTAIFMAPIVVIAFLADRFINYTLTTSKTGDYAVWNDILSGKVDADIVIYGSSRAWLHLNPKIIEDSTGVSAYNLGIDGHNFYMQYLRHHLLLKYDKAPSTIILSLDNFTFDKKKDLYNPEQFLPYLDNKDILDATKTYFGFDYYDYTLPLVRYAGQKDALKNALKIMVKPSLNNIDRYKGYSGQELTWNNDLDKAMAIQKKYVQHFDSATISLFDQFLYEMRDQKIEIIMVYSPEFIGGQRFVSNRKQVFAIYDSFARKYNIPFFDYSADSMSQNKDYFYNSQHLNSNGANIFTRKVIHDIKEFRKEKQLKNQIRAGAYSSASPN
jgi:hypothetical protein